MAVQTPVGAFIDSTSYKKAICVLCCILVSVLSLAIVYDTAYWFVIATRIVQGWGSATLPPTIAAITLGVTGDQKPRFSVLSFFSRPFPAFPRSVTSSAVCFCVRDGRVRASDLLQRDLQPLRDGRLLPRCDHTLP